LAQNGRIALALLFWGCGQTSPNNDRPNAYSLRLVFGKRQPAQGFVGQLQTKVCISSFLCSSWCAAMHHGAVWKVLIANAGWILQEILAAGAVNRWLPLDAVKLALWLKALTFDDWCAALDKVQAVAALDLMAHPGNGQPIKYSSANGFAKPRQA